jgi:para-nitrobenzyl esterase
MKERDKRNAGSVMTSEDECVRERSSTSSSGDAWEVELGAESKAGTRDPVGFSDTCRSTALGVVRGFRNDRCHIWSGIPYAAPPIGPLRWRAPIAPQRFCGIHDATRRRAPASQPDYRRSDGDAHPAWKGEEDCLYLTIYAPVRVQEPIPLPVMVWIHGGGNVGGDGTNFDGTELAGSQNVVVVTVNYRLGVFGWFRHAALRDRNEGEEDQSGNFGTLDIICALRWVSQHIAAFGGDPDNVTLFGESAGAWNIYSLLVCPKAEGLFHRAIVQSGMPVSSTLAEGENFFDDPEPGDFYSSNEIILQLFINDDRATSRSEAKSLLLEMSSDALATYLYGKSYGELEQAIFRMARRQPRAMPLGFPQLFRDGVVIPHQGVAGFIADNGVPRSIPVMLGSNRDEYTILLPLIINPFSSQVPGKFEFLVPDGVRYRLATEYLSKFWRATGVDGPAESMLQHGSNQVFTYRFDWDRMSVAPWLGGAYIGATHGLEVPFVFGSLELGPEFFQLPLIATDAMPSFETLSRAMMSYWAAFAYDGDPGCGRNGELPLWTRRKQHGEKSMLLDDPECGGLHIGVDSTTKQMILEELATDARFDSEAARSAFWRDLLLVGQYVGLDESDR